MTLSTDHVVHAVNCHFRNWSHLPSEWKTGNAVTATAGTCLLTPTCLCSLCQGLWAGTAYRTLQMQDGEIRKTCFMQNEKAGQNMNQEMVSGFPEVLILKSSSDTEHCPFQQPALGNSQDFICNSHSREESSFLFWLLCWIITVKLLLGLNIKLMLLASMNFNIFSSLNCLCYYSNWRCLSLRHLFSCLWNAINVIIHLLHSLEIMTLRMSFLLSIQVAYKPKPCFQRHFLSIILYASQNANKGLVLHHWSMQCKLQWEHENLAGFGTQSLKTSEPNPFLFSGLIIDSYCKRFLKNIPF